MVVSGLGPGGSDPGLDHSRADSLFRTRLCLAPPRIDRAERMNSPSLKLRRGDRRLLLRRRSEETLRDFDFVARAESHILRRIFPKAPHIVNRGVIATEKAHVPL